MGHRVGVGCGVKVRDRRGGRVGGARVVTEVRARSAGTLAASARAE